MDLKKPTKKGHYYYLTAVYKNKNNKKQKTKTTKKEKKENGATQPVFFLSTTFCDLQKKLNTKTQILDFVYKQQYTKQIIKIINKQLLTTNNH